MMSKKTTAPGVAL
jgi:hypothetical protein